MPETCSVNENKHLYLWHLVGSFLSYIRDLYMGISNFKKGYQPRTNIVNDENVDLVADSHSILARWRNNFSQLQNLFDVQTEIHTAESLVPQLSAVEF